jgi:hypothetical protein
MILSKEIIIQIAKKKVYDDQFKVCPNCYNKMQVRKVRQYSSGKYLNRYVIKRRFESDMWLCTKCVFATSFARVLLSGINKTQIMTTIEDMGDVYKLTKRIDNFIPDDFDKPLVIFDEDDKPKWLAKKISNQLILKEVVSAK